VLALSQKLAATLETASTVFSLLQADDDKASGSISSSSSWLAVLQETLWYLQGRCLGALATTSLVTTTATTAPFIEGGGVEEDDESTAASSEAEEAERWFGTALMSNVVGINQEPLSPFIGSLAGPLTGEATASGGAGEALFKALMDIETDGMSAMEIR
jgi:hypothetical protein